MKRLAILSSLVFGLLAPVSVALADQPTREFVPVESDVITGFCGFPVLFEPTQAQLYVMTFTDSSGDVVKIIASGVLKVTLTNQVSGKSIRANISGPEQVRIDESGAVTDTAVGPWLIGFPSEGRLLLTKGRLVFGEGSASLRGTSRDVCVLLG
jgi:hypothetical protein